MALSNWLARRWNRACAEAAGSDEGWWLAVDLLTAHRVLEPRIERFVRGTALDVGAGRQAWRPLLSRRAERYLGADRSLTAPGLALLFDLQHRFPLADSVVDTIFSCSVLEHVFEPWSAFDEMLRVLRPGGVVILSVPFFYYLHDPPRDYYRFSEHAIRRHAERAGFEVVDVELSGGLFHTFFHALSIVACALLWNRAIRLPLRLTTAALSASARALDRFDREHRFAQNVNVVLRRPRASTLCSEEESAQQAGADQ